MREDGANVFGRTGDSMGSSEINSIQENKFWTTIPRGMICVLGSYFNLMI